MADVTKFTTDELMEDLYGCIADVKLCDIAIGHGIFSYSDGESVEERKEKNQKIIVIIKNELERRGVQLG